MMAFLKENWIWILMPVLMVGILLAIGSMLGGDDTKPFSYAIF